MSVNLELEGNRRKVCALAWSGRKRRAYFEYAAEFLAAPLFDFSIPYDGGHWIDCGALLSVRV